jgi:hypothetical protein
VRLYWAIEIEENVIPVKLWLRRAVFPDADSGCGQSPSRRPIYGCQIEEELLIFVVEWLSEENLKSSEIG